ncbi:bacillithiol biosynthesis cysteine-adding enzyme BshC [Paenibacillus soyae]|uniref:Putative cysteine ligase BshC n=1 Tax=Paenibacillus soyae TaxID=2969249 RepID=A0A9X2MNT6_9BACL|nr:bacillithiol biosynthesis cysteine-adding enzyme BshC [Paenibacillus soyae]MCR2803710.1 bacillithiol biosynthesis cysteine-adding enzyme BshC [Paenibacillus soyae]
MLTKESYELPIAQPLTEAYMKQSDGRIRELYGYHSGNEQDWVRRLNSLEEHAGRRADKSKLADALRAYNQRIGVSNETMSSIDLIAEGSPVVIGGQQAGLWTGPLLVIHKAVTIIQAAKSASQQLGRQVVPVFWIAGEDHDWDEANHAYVITAEQELRKLSVARPEGPRTSVSGTAVTAETWKQLLQELEQALPHSEFKPQMLEKLAELARQSGSLSDLFAGILAQLFGSAGMVLVDADDPGLRKLESPMFARLLRHNDELERAYLESADRVKSLGYTLQADVVPGSANLFLFHPERGGERTLLHKNGESFQDRKGLSSWTKEELMRMAEERPELLSNNVLTRPLMQDYLFPVLGTVLGPGEIAYWALTGGAFRALGMEMPIIVPRMSFTLIEGTIAKNMTKYELSFADVIERIETRKEAWLKQQDNMNVEQKFGAVKQAFQEMYQPLIDMAASVQAGLAKLGETNMAKILEQISYMEAKTSDANNKQFEAAIRQFDRIATAIVPSGKPQERVLSVVVYWNRYGDAWLEKLMEAPYSRTGGHEIVYL